MPPKTVHLDPDLHTKLKEQAKKKNIDLAVHVDKLLRFASDRIELVATVFPCIEVMDYQQDKLILWDAKEGKPAIVYSKDTVLFCELDKSKTCNHIKYAEWVAELGRLYRRA